MRYIIATFLVFIASTCNTTFAKAKQPEFTTKEKVISREKDHPISFSHMLGYCPITEKTLVFKEKELARQYFVAAQYGSAEGEKVLQKAIEDDKAKYLEGNTFLLFANNGFFQVFEPGIDEFVMVEDEHGKDRPFVHHSIYPVLDSSYEPWYTADSVLLKLRQFYISDEDQAVFETKDDYEKYVGEEDFLTRKEIVERKNRPIFKISKQRTPKLKKKQILFSSWQNCSIYVRLLRVDKEAAKQFVQMCLLNGTCQRVDGGQALQIESYLSDNEEIIPLKDDVKYICFAHAILCIKGENGEQKWSTLNNLFVTKQ